jgi:alpha-galactosidase
VTNLAAEPYTVDDLVLSFPVPAHASELLDFGGRHKLNWQLNDLLEVAQ